MNIRGLIDFNALRAELGAALGHFHFVLTGETVKAEDGSDEQIACVTPLNSTLDEDDVRAVLEAHVAAGPVRKHNAEIDAQIIKLEASVTQRMLREAAFGEGAVLREIEMQIRELRAKRRTA